MKQKKSKRAKSELNIKMQARSQIIDESPSSPLQKPTRKELQQMMNSETATPINLKSLKKKKNLDQVVSESPGDVKRSKTPKSRKSKNKTFIEEPTTDKLHHVDSGSPTQLPQSRTSKSRKSKNKTFIEEPQKEVKLQDQRQKDINDMKDMTMSAFIRQDNANKNKLLQKIKKWEAKNNIKEQRHAAEMEALLQNQSKSIWQPVIDQYNNCLNPKKKKVSKKKVEHDNKAENIALEEERKKQKDLIKFLDQKLEVQILINKAHYNWKIIRKRIKVVNMMKHTGEDEIREMYRQKNLGKIEIIEDIQPSKFIINPLNYWKMQWGNFLLIITIWYVFLLPLFVSREGILSMQNLGSLLFFDIIFMIDQVLNLLVGFYNKEGDYEPQVVEVILKNYSSDFYFELIYTFGPLLFDLNQLNSAIYFLFKFPRYNRLFEMDKCVTRYLDYYGGNLNVFEIKEINQKSERVQFFIQTTNMIHLLTCTQIMLCIHREYSKSWMGPNGKDVPSNDFFLQYTTSLYFVTTTLSTCGFGDIGPVPRDPVETGAITILIFVGMLFYSYTIQKIQDFLQDQDFNPGEYAANMQDLVENLIVKVGKVINDSDSVHKIKVETFHQWKIFTSQYFNLSPSFCFVDNEFYQSLPENLKIQLMIKEMSVLTRDNAGLILPTFVSNFEILFEDEEYGYKADSKLITLILGSLRLENVYDTEQSICNMSILLEGIYFVHEGKVDVSYNPPPKLFSDPRYTTEYKPKKFLVHESGSYFGDISFIFKTRNFYKFTSQCINNQMCKIFSIQQEHMSEIFTRFEDFYNLMKLRAAQRQHYFKKLRSSFKSKASNFSEAASRLTSLKNVKLTEHNMKYQDLITQELFSDDELTESLRKDRAAFYNKESFKEMDKLTKKVKMLKRTCVAGFTTMLQSFEDIDQQSKEMVFKTFDQNKVMNGVSRSLLLLVNKQLEMVKENDETSELDLTKSRSKNDSYDEEEDISDDQAVNRVQDRHFSKIKNKIVLPDIQTQSVQVPQTTYRDFGLDYTSDIDRSVSMDSQMDTNRNML